MAQYRAVIKGSRGETSRLGHKSSGIRAEVNGWNLGILVYGWSDPEKGDVFEVYLTGGSKAVHDRILIGTFSEAEHRKCDHPEGTPLTPQRIVTPEQRRDHINRLVGYPGAEARERVGDLAAFNSNRQHDPRTGFDEWLPDTPEWIRQIGRRCGWSE